MRSFSTCLTLPAIFLVPLVAGADFIPHTAASGLRFGYQVHIADLNRDGRQDLIGLGAQMDELLWFENPSWEQHVLATDVTQMISVDSADTDGDGIPEIALAYRFTTVPARSPGQIAMLSHTGDPTEPWSLRDIDAIPTTHRIRWADIDGNGEPVIVAAPIVGPDAENQTDLAQRPNPLVYFRPGEWTRNLITDANHGTVHGLMPWDSNGDGVDEVLTASRMGVHAHELQPDGSWSRRELSVGVDAPYPDGGASDLASGTLAGQPFFAAIEPFHGNEVVVYRATDGAAFDRLVIDTELQNGHTVVIADVTGDGNGEIIAAGTRGPQNVYLYRAIDAEGERWERSIIDDTISANNCTAGDINDDGLIDIACINMRAPNELKWYENTGNW